MQQFIARAMTTVCNDFQKGLNTLNTLCDLKFMRFDGQNIPNYADPLHQQFYLLRYFPAYLVEYHKIYQEVVEMDFLEFPLHILSIGCGCGVDYYGLHFVFKKKRKNFQKDVNYTGVDIIDWMYKGTLKNKHTKFLNLDISTWNQLDRNDYNIIIFPKSIGEFNLQTFGRIEGIFRQSHFEQKKICLISSLREQRTTFDTNRFRNLSEILNNTHGYTCLDNIDEVRDYGNQGIRKICYDFVYPEEVERFLTSLLKKCPGYIENNNTSHHDDCVCLNRRPVFRTDHIRYQVARFQKD